MRERRIHILHLQPSALSWTSLGGPRARPRIDATGRLEAEPAEALARWSEHRDLSEDEVYLYDARPLVFGFDFTLPPRADRQLEGILQLKIRQELGMGEDQIRAATGRCNPARPEDVLTLVVRREAVEDVARWRDATKIGLFWMGTDLGAMLTLQALLDSAAPALVAVPADAGLAFHVLKRGERPVRLRPEDVAGHAAELVAAGGAIYAVGMKPAELAARMELPPGATPSPAPVPLPALPLNKAEAAWFRSNEDHTNSLDAIMVVGLIECVFRRPALGSLLGKVEYPSPIDSYARGLRLRREAAILIVVAVAFLGSALYVWRARSAANERLRAEADALEAKYADLAELEGVLAKVKADRVQTTAVIESVYKSAPDGITLQSLDIAENGMLQIAATAKTEASATAFFKEMSASTKFEKVQLANLRIDGGKKWVTFQITAGVKGWKKR